MFTTKHETTIGTLNGKVKLAEPVKLVTEVVLLGHLNPDTGKVTHSAEPSDRLNDLSDIITHYGYEHVAKCLNNGLKLAVNQRVGQVYREKNDPTKYAKAIAEFTKLWAYANQKLKLGAKVSPELVTQLFEQYKDEITAAFEQQE